MDFYRLTITIAILLALVLGSGCQRRAPVAGPATPAPGVTDDLISGERSFEQGQFGDAIAAYERYVRNPEASEKMDQALFQLAIAYTVPTSPNRNPARAKDLLERLVRGFPNSPLNAQAQAILQLQSELDQTKSELEALKRLDLERGR